MSMSLACGLADFNDRHIWGRGEGVVGRSLPALDTKARWYASGIKPALRSMTDTRAVASSPLFPPASSSRSFQTHAATVKFEAFCKGEREKSFADFLVGFLHPVHLHEIFNMSDPMHILKKIVNALWHSDIPHKKRELGMWRVIDGFILVFSQFSLKTAQQVYNEIEFDGDTLTAEERAATLNTFRNLEPGIFHRDNHNCMNVQTSAKVLSRHPAFFFFFLTLQFTVTLYLL